MTLKGVSSMSGTTAGLGSKDFLVADPGETAACLVLASLTQRFQSGVEAIGLAAAFGSNLALLRGFDGRRGRVVFRMVGSSVPLICCDVV